jgi:hypothetical protein
MFHILMGIMFIEDGTLYIWAALPTFRISVLFFPSKIETRRLSKVPEMLLECAQCHRPKAGSTLVLNRRDTLIYSCHYSV